MSVEDALAVLLSPPLDCLVSKKLRGYGEDTEWNLTNWLIAEQIDELRGFFSSMSGSKETPPRIKRPGIDEKKTNRIETASMDPSEFQRIRGDILS